jgi:redox-sensitive bicupin YhaK (pirin superfamily)
VTIHSNTKLYAGLFDGPEATNYDLEKGRIAYLHLAKGKARINGEDLVAGDALMLVEESQVSISHGVDSEVLLFDLPVAALAK